MTGPMRFLRESNVVRNDLHENDRPWMRSVVATGIGWKISDGKSTKERAIHLFVDRKRKRSSIAKDSLVPRSIDGIRTDVVSLRSPIAFDAIQAPSAMQSVGCGAGVTGDASGEHGTVGCCARLTDGRIVAITAGHVLANGEFAANEQSTRRIGRTLLSVDTMVGEDLYPGNNAGDRPCAVDLALFELDEDVPVFSGFSNGQSFALDDWLTQYKWLASTQNLRAMTINAAHPNGRSYSGVRDGIVVSLLPRCVVDGITYLCAVNDNGQSMSGDSGSLWFAQHGDHYVALGLHQGVMRSTNLALVTNFSAALSHVGISELLGGG